MAFVTSKASSTDWPSLTVSVNLDISGEAGTLAGLPDEGGGGGGVHRQKMMRSRS